jgi:hypothetical protein
MHMTNLLVLSVIAAGIWSAIRLFQVSALSRRLVRVRAMNPKNQRSTHQG